MSAMRTTINELLSDYKKVLHHDITVQGWVRAFRSNRFIALNDGSTINNLQVGAENISDARSRIQDADFAKESGNLSRASILQQAGTAMLAQANQSQQGALQLLG